MLDLARSGSRAVRLQLYVGLVIAAGFGAIGLSLSGTGPGVGGAYAEFWMLACFVALGELLPVNMRGGHGEMTTSTIFTFALLLRFGAGAAIIAQAIASVLADLATRKPLWKATFNVSQYALSLGISGAVLAYLLDAPNLGAIPGFHAGELPAILLSACVFFLINNTLPRVGMALSNNAPIGRFLLDDLAHHASINGVLLALAPIVVIAGERSLVMIPLLAVPMGIVYKAATVYADKEYKAHLALHDSLTGLPNRSLLYDRVQQAIAEAERHDTKIAVLLIDLDRFKEINDSLGHHIGDLLLQRVGPRLKSVLREYDTIARLGGDEFAVVLPDISGPDHAIEIASRIERVLEEAFFLEEVSGELTLDIEASVGIAIYPEHGDDVASLIQRADVAMYVAKEGHGGFELYTDERDRHSSQKLAMLGELRKAIDEDQLFLEYQPKVHMQSGRVNGVEALARWEHPKHGLIMPDTFIPPAERTGLIRPLTLKVIDMALEQSKAWQDQGVFLTVAVNLARRNLLDNRFPDEVAALLFKWGVTPRFLELEITESSIMADPARASEVLARLSRMGIRLALDDFGAGYSSLAYLTRLPVNEIKIDKSFVMNMNKDANDKVIVHSTIDLAHNLGLAVIAEGVEDEELTDQLRAFGCDVGQGFHFSRPISAVELGDWIEAHERARNETAPDVAQEALGAMSGVPSSMLIR